ncbi:MAG: ABC transporter permease [Alphaproteobacteria bacterium]|nr:ABC transporter permease [Alphaproteobacteria bacterium]
MPLLPAGSPARPHGALTLSFILGGILLLFILLPLLALTAGQSPATLARVAGSRDVLDAIALSLAGAALATLCAALFGVPLGYVLARTSFPGKTFVSAVVDIPLAVPHTVAGIALLFVFGRQGLIGAPAAALGVQFWGTLACVVVAMLFVSVPYTVNSARLGFEAVDLRLEHVARTLGLGPWHALYRVTLPLARRGIMTGLTLTFARAIAEFGAVVILVYYPMTAPVKIYELFIRFGLDEATGTALLLLTVALALFLLLRWFAYGRSHSSGTGR